MGGLAVEILYADDFVLLAGNMEEWRMSVINVKSSKEKKGLKVNLEDMAVKRLPRGEMVSTRLWFVILVTETYGNSAPKALVYDAHFW